ncbi:MAG: DUF1028 domain-containing protein [Pseudomonadota bacterium]
MTFSIVGRCARCGQFGVAITTSSISVGARCPHVRAGVGAVTTQNVTNPSLGPAVLDRLQSGLGAGDALRVVMGVEEFPEYRQVAVVDARGDTAIHTGEKILGRHAEAVGTDCIAAGNLLASTDLPRAMCTAFADAASRSLPDRLLTALEAGIASGGEEGETHSAALLVAGAQPFPLVDLRVDWADTETVPTLRRLWTNYDPQMQAYLDRAINPSAAPSYGVPGDP